MNTAICMGYGRLYCDYIRFIYYLKLESYLIDSSFFYVIYKLIESA